MTILNFFAKSAKEEGEEVQKIAEKIRYLRRDTFVDNTLVLAVTKFKFSSDKMSRLRISLKNNWKFTR